MSFAGLLFGENAALYYAAKKPLKEKVIKAANEIDNKFGRMVSGHTATALQTKSTRQAIRGGYQRQNAVNAAKKDSGYALLEQQRDKVWQSYFKQKKELIDTHLPEDGSFGTRVVRAWESIILPTALS